MEAAFKHLEGVLSQMKADMAKLNANWASKRERMESSMVKAEREATEAMEKYKAFEGLAVEKAQVVANIKKSEEFYALC